MFANIISKRALSISRMVGSQVRPLTSIYGVDVKSTAKFSYSAAALSKDHQNRSKDSTDYTKFVVQAQEEIFLVADWELAEFPANFIDAYVHNTFWYIGRDPPGTTEVMLRAICPKNETCHAEVLFIAGNSLMQKVYKEFRRHDKNPKEYTVVYKCHVERVVIRILEEKQKYLEEFENRWAKDVTFVVNGEKCAGDRQYLSAISPVFKKMLQDHAQDEITLEGVESSGVLKDFFLAVSPLRVQPNLTNVVPFLKLAKEFDIPFLMRSCEECLKICYEISYVDRFLLALKYNLNSLKIRMTNKDLAKILKEKKEMLSEPGNGFLFDVIAERLKNDAERE
ncbi:BTB/POZ domain-containing protein [Ditylenchus destructor]|nr:BTB/POZ domain-containing protein [Ditylenchus destructor]